MNKYQLYTLSGTLLAATSLAGAASAGSVGTIKSGTFTAGAVKISNTALSGTATVAAAQTLGGVSKNIAIQFTNGYDSSFNLQITVPVSGANFVQANPSVDYLLRTSTPTAGTYAATASATSIRQAGTVGFQVLGNSLFLSNVQLTAGSSVNGVNSAQIGGLLLGSIQFTNAAGLATAGTSITIGATVSQQGNSTQVYETVAFGSAVTSAAPIATTVSAGTTGVVNGVSSPTLYTNFSSGAGAGLTLTLATVSITATGTVGTDLSTLLIADGQGATATHPATSSLSVTLASGTLSDAAASSLVVVSASNTVETLNGGLAAFTTSAFSTGSVTFTLTASADTYTGSFAITLQYLGTTAISQVATAGTASVAFSVSTSTASIVAPATASGSTAIVNRGGMSAEFDYASNGGGNNGFYSYLRIHNKGTSAATASIVLKNDATGAQVGSTTYTTGSIPGGGTIQVAISSIESALGVTPTAGSTYTASVSGSFPGYAQHITFNPTSGVFGDLDGFRNGSGGTLTAP